jgi:hypothetical protein
VKARRCLVNISPISTTAKLHSRYTDTIAKLDTLLAQHFSTQMTFGALVARIKFALIAAPRSSGVNDAGKPQNRKRII